MNTSKINIISVLKIIYILLALLLIAQILKNLNLSVDFLLLGFSALCYLVSHIIRAIRLRFVISSNEFNTQKALFVQLGAASLGNLLFPLAKDLLAAVLIFFVSKKNLIKSFVAILYLRFFDFLVITPLLYIVILSGEPEKGGVALSLILLILIILFTLITLPKLCKIVVDYLIKYSHTKRSLNFIRFFSSIKTTYIEMNLNNIEKSLIVILMTISIWLFELLSIFLFGFDLVITKLLDAYIYMLGNVIKYIPYTKELVTDNELYLYPYLILLIASCVYITGFKNDSK